MFKFSKKTHSRSTSSDSSSPALLAILTGPTGPTRATPIRRSQSSLSTASNDSALGRILSGSTTPASKHTTAMKSERCDLTSLNDGLRRAEELERLVKDGLIIVHDKRRKERRTPRRSMSDDGSSLSSSRRTGSRRSLGCSTGKDESA
jgi:hypothetical protein